MIKTDGTPTIAWAPIIDSDPGDETDHAPCPYRSKKRPDAAELKKLALERLV